MNESLVADANITLRTLEREACIFPPTPASHSRKFSACERLRGPSMRQELKLGAYTGLVRCPCMLHVLPDGWRSKHSARVCCMRGGRVITRAAFCVAAHHEVCIRCVQVAATPARCCNS
jgi:hypothetical protein